MELSILLGIVTAILLAIFSSFLFSKGKNIKASSLFLAFFLLSNLLYIVSYLGIIGLSDSLNPSSIDLIAKLGHAFGFLFGPTLFLFSNTLINKQRKPRSVDFLHFLPFLLFSVISFLPFSLNNWANFSAFNIHVFSYLLLSLWLIRAQQSSIGSDKLTWLLYVIGAFIVMWSIDFVNILLISIELIDSGTGSNLSLISLGINLIFVIVIFYQALRQPSFLYDSESVFPKYQKSTLEEFAKEKILARIEEYFQASVPYLDAGLTIDVVAQAVNTPSKHVSQVINELHQKNFYDFTNSYRIEHAKRLLTLRENADKTILEILHESGFNSKSAFNNAFKKNTGTTPTQFKKLSNPLL